MKKQWLTSGAMIILIGSFLMISCKKESSATSPVTSKPITLNDVLSKSYSPAIVAAGNFTPTSTVNSELQNLNWHYFLDNHLCDSFAHTPLDISLPAAYSSINTRVFLVGPNKIMGYISGNGNASGPAFSNYFYKIPANFNWKVLAIAVVDSKYYYALQSVTISADATNNLVTVSSLTEVSESDLIKIISGL